MTTVRRPDQPGCSWSPEACGQTSSTRRCVVWRGADIKQSKAVDLTCYNNNNNNSVSLLMLRNGIIFKVI